MGSQDVGGKVVLITGGARGIGRATAVALRAAGARVAIGDIDESALVGAQATLGDNVLTGLLDVTDRRSFSAFLALVERELGPLDVLVNNAGIMPIGPMVAEPDEVAGRVFEINVLGCLLGMKLALPGMIERGRGHVVNLASVAGKSPVPGGASYAASKAAILSLTESARVEHRGTGVSFTAVIPSFTATDLIAGTKGTKFVATIQPEDVATAIVAAMRRPRADVYVPRSVGAILRSQPLIGRRLRDAVNRSIRADRVFLEVDAAARADYDARIRAAEATASPEEHAGQPSG
jgi:NADP-dependent 3-hydroxy acid dehydrogenase YdfG